MKKTNEVSKQVGVTKRTLQYYDEKGLIIVERTSNNYRMYDKKTLERIWHILVYKEMNLELKEIKHLLELSDGQKKIFLKKRMEEIKNEAMNLKVQMGFISLVQKYGMPPAPLEGSGITYKTCIEELRQRIRIETAKEEEGNINEQAKQNHGKDGKVG